MSLMVSMRPIPTAARCLRKRLASPRIAAPGSVHRSYATASQAQETSIDSNGAAIPPVVSARLQQRKEALRNAKPFSDFLTDSFNREHDYLRISITERCNLRCLYCMPEEGVPLSPPEHMLTTPEIFYLSSLFVSQGVTKIRLTGGEPTVRRDIVPLMQSIGSLRSQGLCELALTTNGISLHRKLDAMVEAGLTGVNLSLDTLDPFQFQIMTRRNGFDAVMRSIERILEMNKLGANVKLKVNCVVMRGLNERDIIPFVELGREKDIEVRFIEYMPFGGNKWSEGKMISFQEMLDIIRVKYPGLRSVKGHKNDTSKTYEVPGFVGKVGFISSMTNDFCGTCNRLRITSDGNLKVCLHGNDEVSLRDMLRKDNNGQPIDQEAFERIKQIEMDRRDGLLSDETILGWGQREQELLHVIGAAVKRKAEKHADMGDLKNMQNRPMILIGQSIQPSPARTSLVDDGRSRFGMQNAYSSGAALVRPWSSIPPPRLSHSLFSLQSGPFHVRTFGTHRRGTGSRRNLEPKMGTGSKEDTKLKMGNGSSKSSLFGTKHLDKEWEHLEEGRRGSECAMLQSLDTSQAEQRALMSRQEMLGPEYERYWAQINHITVTRTIDRDDSKEAASRAVEELQKIHLDIDDVTAQRQVCSSIKSTSQKSIRPSQLFPNHRHAEFSVDRSVQVKAVQDKIKDLEWRLEVAKEYPPQVDPGEFLAWRDKIEARFAMKAGRKTSRAMWRRNKKIAAAALKNEERRRQLEHVWKAEMHELEQTLHTFKSRLVLLAPDNMENIQQLQAKQRQLDQEAEKLSVEEKEVLAARSVRMEKALVERAEKRARVAEKKDQARLEAGHAKVKWDGLLAATWRRDRDAAAKVVAEGSAPFDAASSARERAAPRVDALEDRLQETITEQPFKSKSGRRLDGDKIRNMEPVGRLAGKDDKQPKNIKKSMEYDETRVAEPRDKDARQNLEPVAQEAFGKLAGKDDEQSKSIKKSMEHDGMRVTGSRDEDASRNLEPVAHKTQNLQAELKDLIPEQRDPTAEVRQQQLRDIHQSILHLQKLASSAQSDGHLRVATARKIEDMLRELEEEAATVENDQALHSFIRKSNANPDLKHIKFNRQQIAEQQQAANVFGESNKPQPIRTWPNPSPEALLPRSLSDQLKAQLSASKQSVIDDDLTVDVEADVPGLQNQIFELSQRLKENFPLMDTLPYDVWKSKQRKTLQTWLKILIWKWQTRNDEMNAESAEADIDVSQDVRALLDQMVLDHDLGQHAATRMAKRWAEVFVRQEERKMGVEPDERNEELDWAQMDPGLGFLDDECDAVDQERGRGYDAAREKTNQSLPQGLPFTNKRKTQGYRFGASDLWRAASAAGYHTLASRRQYSSWKGTKVGKVEVGNPTEAPETQTSHHLSSSSAEHLQTSLPHLTASGAAHMVSVSAKPHTPRTAIATGTVRFSNPTPLSLIHSASNKKGDVLSVSRIAGIMAAKHTPSLIPLCHPIALTHVGVTLHVLTSTSPVEEKPMKDFGAIVVESKVQCVGQTGVEMEALTSVVGAALSVVDMCKAVDKGISIGDVRVVLKEGGRSGTWREDGWESRGEDD